MEDLSQDEDNFDQFDNASQKSNNSNRPRTEQSQPEVQAQSSPHKHSPISDQIHYLTQSHWQDYLIYLKNTFNWYISFSWIICLFLAYNDNSQCSNVRPYNMEITFRTWLKVEGFSTLFAFVNHVGMLIVLLWYPNKGRILTVVEIIFLPFKLLWNVLGFIIFLEINVNVCSNLLQNFAAIYFVTFGYIIFVTMIKYLNKLHREAKEIKKRKIQDVLQKQRKDRWQNALDRLQEMEVISRLQEELAKERSLRCKVMAQLAELKGKHQQAAINKMEANLQEQKRREFDQLRKIHEAQIQNMKKTEQEIIPRNRKLLSLNSQTSKMWDLGAFGTIANKRSSMEFEQYNQNGNSNIFSSFGPPRQQSSK